MPLIAVMSTALAAALDALGPGQISQDVHTQLDKALEGIKGSGLEDWPFRVLIANGPDGEDALAAVIFEGKAEQSSTPTWEWQNQEVIEEWEGVPEPWFPGYTDGVESMASEDVQRAARGAGLVLASPGTGCPGWLDEWDDLQGEWYRERHPKLSNPPTFEQLIGEDWKQVDRFHGDNVLDALMRGYSFVILFDTFTSPYFRWYFLHPIPIDSPFRKIFDSVADYDELAKEQRHKWAHLPLVKLETS